MVRFWAQSLSRQTILMFVLNLLDSVFNWNTQFWLKTVNEISELLPFFINLKATAEWQHAKARDIAIEAYNEHIFEVFAIS